MGRMNLIVAFANPQQPKRRAPPRRSHRSTDDRHGDSTQVNIGSSRSRLRSFRRRQLVIRLLTVCVRDAAQSVTATLKHLFHLQHLKAPQFIEGLFLLEETLGEGRY